MMGGKPMNPNPLQKVCMDPVHGEIILSPLEMLCMDTRAVQRLRHVSQLAGAERVFPGATHSRFLHSLGVMHVAGMYADHLQLPSARRVLLRLAGLLHDIGHGPFSHQFDEIVYPKAGLEEGHDQMRASLLLEWMPGDLLHTFSNLKGNWRHSIALQLAEITGMHVDPDEKPSLEKAFAELMATVNQLFQGEHEGTADFNIVQGPLGADRLDFLLRDAYYCGTRQYGTVDLQRIVRYSFLSPQNDVERLCYESKIMDNIYTVLFGRFMMYKNVYFHKTARAADLMLQEILSLCVELFQLEKETLNLERFVQMTEGWLMARVHQYYKDNNFPSEEVARKAKRAHQLLQDYQDRKLWKLLLESSFSVTGMDPSALAGSVGKEGLSSIDALIRAFLAKNPTITDEEKTTLQGMLDHPQEFFVVDTPYKLSLAHPAEFLANQVFLLIRQGSETRLMDFETFLKESAFYQSLSGKLVQMVRVYLTHDNREMLQKYHLLPEKKNVHLTTRW